MLFRSEDLGEVSVFQRERDFGFCLLCGDGKLSCCCKFGNERGVREEAFIIALEDPVDLAIVQRVLEVLILRIVVEIVIEAGIIDSVYVDMVMSAWEGLPEKGIISLGISSMGGIKVL